MKELRDGLTPIDRSAIWQETGLQKQTLSISELQALKRAIVEKSNLDIFVVGFAG